MIKTKRKTKRGQALLSLSLCLKKGIHCFTKNVFSKKKKNLSSKSPYRFPLSPSVFNSRLSLSKTGLAGHPPQVFCPDAYPPKWQDVWHTFLVAKGVDNSTWGSKMTKIEPTPKCGWTQPPFHIFAFSNSPWRESPWKTLPSINYSANAKRSFFKKKKLSAGLDVMIDTRIILSWPTEEQFLQQEKTQKTLPGSSERRTDPLPAREDEKEIWGRNKCT